MDDETFDFGLDPGESFEPEDAGEEEDFDLSRPHVMTLLGPIDPDELGFTLFISGKVRTLWRDDPGSAVADLEMAHYAGLRAVTMLLDRRDSDEEIGLLWIARRSPVHLVVAEREAVLASADGWEIVDAGEAGDRLVTEIARRKEARQLDRIIPQVDTDRSLTDVIERVPLLLMERGLSATDIRALFLENPARALTRTRISGES
jgi:hypothetical protein